MTRKSAARRRATHSLVAGVDGWSKGWVAVVLQQGRFEEALQGPTFPGLLLRLQAASVIAVDIPIGPPDFGRRPADDAARRYLGRRGPCVFDVPARQVLEAPTYAAARNLSSSRFGRGLSVQSYALGTKILEVDACARGDPRIIEVHPEVSFAALAGQALKEKKKSWNGQMRRRQLLADEGITLPGDLGDAGLVPADDLLDAAAAAWTALRYSRGKARPLPEDTLADSPERQVAIWR